MQPIKTALCSFGISGGTFMPRSSTSIRGLNYTLCWKEPKTLQLKNTQALKPIVRWRNYWQIKKLHW